MTISFQTKSIGLSGREERGRRHGKVFLLVVAAEVRGLLTANLRLKKLFV